MSETAAVPMVNVQINGVWKQFPKASAASFRPLPKMTSSANFPAFLLS